MSNLKWTCYGGSYSADVGVRTVTIVRGHNGGTGDHWVWRVWKGTAVVAGGTAPLLAKAKADAVAAVNRLEAANV